MASFLVNLNLSRKTGLINVARNNPTTVVLTRYTTSLDRFCGCTRESVKEPEKQAIEASGSSKNIVRNLSALTIRIDNFFTDCRGVELIYTLKQHGLHSFNKLAL